MGEETLVTLQPGQRVGNNWIITEKVGAGALGAVYICRGLQGLDAALKTEPFDTCLPFLSMEAKVHQELNRRQVGRHFAKCHDMGQDTQSDLQGRQATFKYIVVALTGKSIRTLIEERPEQRFSPGTAIGVSIQLINALMALHDIGYLHRDVKPSNSSIGRSEEKELRVVYLLDFSMARKYTREDGSLRPPRQRSNFRGSPRYACTSAHINRDYSRRDDIENWFYVMVEIYKGSLPWGHTGDINEIGEYKLRRMRSNPAEVRRQAVRELVDGCPAEFEQLLEYIDSLKFYSRPDYCWIKNLLRSHLTNSRIEEFPYDWEQDGPDPHDGGGAHFLQLLLLFFPFIV